MARETPIVREQKPTIHEKTMRHRYSVSRGRGVAWAPTVIGDLEKILDRIHRIQQDSNPII